MGTLCFLHRTQKASGPLFAIFMILAFAVQGLVHGWLGASVGVLTSIFILFFPEVNSRILIWTGMISYSLYLVHVPIGGRIINIAEKLPDTPAIRLLALLIAMALSLLIAALFFRFVEQPSHQLSRQIRQKSAGSAAG
jgi:peptidoglycan/LPS O-acetylase OafA/YrhL